MGELPRKISAPSSHAAAAWEEGAMRRRVGATPRSPRPRSDGVDQRRRGLRGRAAQHRPQPLQDLRHVRPVLGFKRGAVLHQLLRLFGVGRWVFGLGTGASGRAGGAVGGRRRLREGTEEIGVAWVGLPGELETKGTCAGKNRPTRAWLRESGFVARGDLWARACASRGPRLVGSSTPPHALGLLPPLPSQHQQQQQQQQGWEMPCISLKEPSHAPLRPCSSTSDDFLGLACPRSLP